MDPAVLRDDMVDSLQHDSKGVVRSAWLSAAMRAVPREAFVGEQQAYSDRPFERMGTRVLSPSTVARLLEALDPGADDDVLVVGAGVGYTAAVLAEQVGAAKVQAIDITRRLVHDARSNLAEAGYEGVLVDRRDGADGLPEYAPYDRILVEAAAVGANEQTLAIVDSDGEAERLGSVAFQPMLVEGEQADTIERNRTRREDRERAERAAESRTGWEQDWIDWDD